MIGAVTDKKRPIVESSLPSQPPQPPRAAAGEDSLRICYDDSIFSLYLDEGAVLRSLHRIPILTPPVFYVREAAINVDCVIFTLGEINWNVLIKFIVLKTRMHENRTGIDCKHLLLLFNIYFIANRYRTNSQRVY